MKVKHLFLIILLIIGSLVSCNQGDANKKAMLVVSFGTSYSDSRALTIDATVNEFKTEFAGYDIFSAFTSQTIIDILDERDQIDVYNVEEALKAIKKEGYATVVIQSLHVMNGAEYDDMLAVIAEYEDDFSDVKVGKALLTTHDDYLTLVDGVSKNFPALNEDEAVVLMGHGTHHEANAVYSALEYVFKTMGFDNVYVGTVEGFPTFDDVLVQLEEDGINKVTLMPLMIVAGDHAENDMGGDEEDSWKTMLKQNGFEVEVFMHGLGENEVVRNLFIEHAVTAIEGEYLD